MLRAISAVIALAVSMIGLVFPFILARQPTGLNQSVLLIMMFGVSAAFTYGVGFRPDKGWLRAAIAPTLTWPLMLACVAILLLSR